MLLALSSVLHGAASVGSAKDKVAAALAGKNALAAKPTGSLSAGTNMLGSLMSSAKNAAGGKVAQVAGGKVAQVAGGLKGIGASGIGAGVTEGFGGMLASAKNAAAGKVAGVAGGKVAEVTGGLKGIGASGIGAGVTGGFGGMLASAKNAVAGKVEGQAGSQGGEEDKIGFGIISDKTAAQKSAIVDQLVAGKKSDAKKSAIIKNHRKASGKKDNKRDGKKGHKGGAEDGNNGNGGRRGRPRNRKKRGARRRKRAKGGKNLLSKEKRKKVNDLIALIKSGKNGQAKGSSGGRARGSATSVLASGIVGEARIHNLEMQNKALKAKLKAGNKTSDKGAAVVGGVKKPAHDGKKHSVQGDRRAAAVKERSANTPDVKKASSGKAS